LATSKIPPHFFQLVAPFLQIRVDVFLHKIFSGLRRPSYPGTPRFASSARFRKSEHPASPPSELRRRSPSPHRIHMRIFQQFSIRGQDGQPMHSRRCRDHAIRGIRMKRPGKGVRFFHHFPIRRQHPPSVRRYCFSKPGFPVIWQLNPTPILQTRQFRRRHGGEKNRVRLFHPTSRAILYLGSIRAQKQHGARVQQ